MLEDKTWIESEAEKAVSRFKRNLINGLEELIKDGTITENSTVKEVLEKLR